MNTHIEKLYAFQFLLALDRFGGAVFFRRSGVTLSTMTGLGLRQARHPWYATLLGTWFLERFWPGHCEQAIRYDASCMVQSLSELGFHVTIE